MLVRTVSQLEKSVVYWLWFLVVEYLIVGKLLSHTVLKLSVPLGLFPIMFLLVSFVIGFSEEKRHLTLFPSDGQLHLIQQTLLLFSVWNADCNHDLVCLSVEHCEVSQAKVFNKPYLLYVCPERNIFLLLLLLHLFFFLFFR